MTKEVLTERITAYLSGGGLFNSELADHVAVRDLLIECRDALAQPDQYAKGYADAMNWKVQNHLEHLPTAQPEQEPVAWRAPNWGHGDDEWVYRDFDDPVLIADGKPSPNNEPLYTNPLKRQWVGLTDEEIKEIVGPYGDIPIKGYTRKLFYQIEAKLEEKNT